MRSMAPSSGLAYRRLLEAHPLCLGGVATSHYLSESDVACAGAWPHVFRVHHYCLSPMRDDADVRLHPRPAPRAKAIDATAAGGGDSSCLHELFVEVPALCRVPPFGDEAPRRLERLLDEVYANRSGYVASAQHDFPDPIPPGDAQPDDAARMVEMAAAAAARTPRPPWRRFCSGSAH